MPDKLYKEMPRTCKNATSLYALLIVVGLAIGFLLGRCVSRRAESPSPEVVRDTVVLREMAYRESPVPKRTSAAGFVEVPRYHFITDTVVVNVVETDTLIETVYLPREQIYYEEEGGDLRVWVSGYQPRLDRYELDRATTVITERVKQPPRRWGLGVVAGYGASLSEQKVSASPFVGVGISYNLLTW